MGRLATDRRRGPARFRFEHPLDVRILAIDGSWCREYQLIEVSELSAQDKPERFASDRRRNDSSADEIRLSRVPDVQENVNRWRSD